MSTIKPSHFHFNEPHFQRENFEIPTDVKLGLCDKLKRLYGQTLAEKYYSELERIIKVYYAYKSPEMIQWEKSFQPENRFSEKDIILITYGDLIWDDDQSPLQTLAELCDKYLKGVFNTLHILPFFPSSSDRGFSVMDFTEVDPHLGTWEDILALKEDFKLMFDGVFNHVSSKSKWFQEFLNQNPKFINFFTVFSTSDKIPADYLKLLVRPRTSEVLTAFKTLAGRKFVWTTFSQDQIDLNFSNPEVLLKMIEILLFYIVKGADLIRLDAVTYLWDELGTTGVHLSQTHTIVKLFREILDAVAPHVALITETNVPHEDNIKYFGEGVDEAQMVYNFALPPLVLHSFQTGNTRKLSQWAKNLPKVSDTATFFNFLDSHDGIGVTAVRNILTQEEIEMMALRVIENGGFISYRSEGDGSQSPYELNITWYSAINSLNKKENDEIQVKRYLASRAIALILQGVPGIYLHGLLGSKNDAEAVIEEEQTRSINRKSLNKKELIRALLDPATTTYQVSYKLVSLIMKRSHQKAFHPNAKQEIIEAGEGFFTVLRTSTDSMEQILAIINVTNENQLFKFEQTKLPLSSNKWRDIISKQEFNTTDDIIRIELKPYDIFWLKPVSEWI
jgi:sucrose phosphorylase